MSEAFKGTTFFFFGRAAKPMKDLPEFDYRSIVVQPGLRAAKNDDESNNYKIKEAVEKAAKTCEERGYLDAL